MRIFHLALFIGALLPQLANATEQQQLALALKQAELLSATLERARTEAAQQQSTDRRYFFDYSAVQRDLNLLQDGILHYLSPERAQPRMLNPESSFTGLYRSEGE